jgi:Sec-independent protein translocase protein TatA
VFNLGMGEITVILLLALIFLGPSKLPDLAGGLGKLIKEIRKATSDVKNEIALDDSFRKPFEELRDAVTLHPDELKRRDQLRKDMDEATRRAAEETARAEAESASQGADAKLPPPPDGLASPVTIPGVSRPFSQPRPAPHPGANDTIVQAAPDPADFPPPPSDADIPTPPPERVTARAKPLPPAAPPAGTVARGDSQRRVSVPSVLGGTNGKGAPPALGKAAPAAPAAPTAAPATPAPELAVKAPTQAPAVKAPTQAPAAKAPTPAAKAPTPAAPPAGGDAANITQILKEEDLIPSTSSGKPPPPPHLPGLVRRPTPRPGSTPPMPPMPPVPDTKKKT